MTHTISEYGIITFTGPDGSFSAPLVELKATIDALDREVKIPTQQAFLYGTHKFVAVPRSGCRNCAFDGGSLGFLCGNMAVPPCVAKKRADGTGIIWKEVI